MDFLQANSSNLLEPRGAAFAGRPRATIIVAGAVLCAAAAAVAAVPLQPTSASVTSTSVTTPLPAVVRRPPPETVFADPTAAAVQFSASFEPGADLRALLVRSGVAAGDAVAAAGLVSDALPAGVAERTRIDLLLGPSTRKGERRLERLSFQPGRTFQIVVGRTLAGTLKLARDAVFADATPQRFRGKAGSELFWSLRAAGVPAEAARDYLDAISTRVDPRAVRLADEFDLVVDHWRDASGKGDAGPLLYAALRRASGGGVQLVRWTVGSRTGWFDPARPQQRVDGFEQPVQGSVTSSFGYRIHPILRFARFHEGVDFGAPWGAPVVAAADGVVGAAGWNGGHGRQVRLMHAGGVVTSYSHLSQILAVPGTRVRRGQLIGLVGSSGFSTGAHLHFEVRRDGRPLDPMRFRQPAVETIGSVDLAALRARLEQLRSI